MHMSSEPGDLVLDITCGSGTTPYVAEKWGRRWIAIDTARVPISLARQRLLTSTFPWYELKDLSNGPADGFVYESKKNRKGRDIGGEVPHITLGAIANDWDTPPITRVDRPKENKKITRVCGPFTVEATIKTGISLTDENSEIPDNCARAYIERMIEVLRRSGTLRLQGNEKISLREIRKLSQCEHLHAEGILTGDRDHNCAIVFGPEDGPIGYEVAFNASIEAMQRGFKKLFLFGFAIQSNTREMLDKLKIPTRYVSITLDVTMSDLLRTTKSSEIFSIVGVPDITLKKVEQKNDEKPKYSVSVNGLDVYHPNSNDVEEVETKNLPCWMLDTNYNGRAFHATQVFFPKTKAWENLKVALRHQFSDSVWAHLAGTASEPFYLGDQKRIAVKVVDERGNELMATRSERDAE